MHTPSLTGAITAGRFSGRRAFEAVRQALRVWGYDALTSWRRAKRRQLEWEELQSLAELDHRTLIDIGWPDDMRRRVDPLDRRQAPW